MRRCEVVYFIYVARDRDHFRDFGTSASHMTHEDFRSVECVIIITLILRSEQRLLYVIFQIFPRFHFPVHCPSLIIFHTFFLFCRFLSILTHGSHSSFFSCSLHVSLIVYHQKTARITSYWFAPSPITTFSVLIPFFSFGCILP